MKKLILSSLFCLAMTSFASAGWNGVEWGMTMQQTMNALNSKSKGISNVRTDKLLANNDPEMNNEYIIAAYISPTGPTRALYKFDKKKRLSRINYEVSSNDCKKAVKGFEKQYGKPFNDEYRANTKQLSLHYTKWHIGDTEISVGELITPAEKSCLVMLYKTP